MAEEIKDVVASTVLWLVVREARGGVGKDEEWRRVEAKRVNLLFVLCG